MKIKIAILVVFVGVLCLLYSIPKLNTTKKMEHLADFSSNIPQVELYYSIIKYSKEYNVPEGYLFAIAKHETGYQGPNDNQYKSNLVSSANAVGAMQIKLSTAKMFDKDITYDQLKNNIDSNVKISAMALRHLYKYYGDWQLAFGAYNTGRPLKNDYSKYVVDKNFNWK